MLVPGQPYAAKRDSAHQRESTSRADERQNRSFRSTDGNGYRPDRSIKPYNPAEFVHDFILELNRRQHPRFGERSWWESLRVACERDVMRLVIARNTILDSEYFAMQHTFELHPWADERVDSRAAWNRGNRWQRA